MSPEVLFHEFGEDDALTLDQFNASIPIVLSCLVYLSRFSFRSIYPLINGRQARRDCALSTDEEFVEEHEEEEHSRKNEEDHEEEEHSRKNEEDHEEEEGHLHGHEGEHGEHDHDEIDEDNENDEIDEDNENDEIDEDNEIDEDEDDDTMHIKIIALVVLFVESVIGSMVPISAARFKGSVEVLSLLNCFAGGILMSTGSHFAQARFSLCRRFFIGIIHLIPRIIKYEADVGGLGDYALRLSPG